LPLPVPRLVPLTSVLAAPTQIGDGDDSPGGEPGRPDDTERRCLRAVEPAVPVEDGGSGLIGGCAGGTKQGGPDHGAVLARSRATLPDDPERLGTRLARDHRETLHLT